MQIWLLYVLIEGRINDEAVQFINFFFLITKLSKPNIVLSPLKCDFSAVPVMPSSLFSKTNTQIFSFFLGWSVPWSLLIVHIFWHYSPFSLSHYLQAWWKWSTKQPGSDKTLKHLKRNCKEEMNITGWNWGESFAISFLLEPFCSVFALFFMLSPTLLYPCIPGIPLPPSIPQSPVLLCTVYSLLFYFPCAYQPTCSLKALEKLM